MALEVFIDLQDRSHITTSVAVVGSRPDRDQALAEPVLEAIHNELMRTGDELKVIDVIELVCDARSE